LKEEFNPLNEKRPIVRKWIPTIAAFLLFSLSGLLSVFLYFSFSGADGFIFPGLLYTSSTVLLFAALKIPFTAKKITWYYFLMIATYLGIWLITLISSWFGVIMGIVTAGTGSMITFYLTDRFIKRIAYDRNIVFAWGSLAFLLTDILYWSSPADGSPYCDWVEIESEPAALFGEVFFPWHVIVGLNLLYVLWKDPPEQ
jgi:hypothetical protein